MNKIHSIFKCVITTMATMLVGISSAEVLVYEGFSSNDYTLSASIRDAKSVNDSIGMDNTKGWFSATGVYFAQSSGLTLPEGWEENGVYVGDGDLRCVIKNNASATTVRCNRAQQRGINYEWPESGTIYLRFVMRVSQSLLKTTFLGVNNYWMAGLGTSAISNPASDSSNITNGVYMGVRNNAGTLRFSGYVYDPATSSIVTTNLFTIDTSKQLDCIAVAKIDYDRTGENTISFYAAPIDSWNNDFEWIGSFPAKGLISREKAFNHLQMIGQYRTADQWVSFDEFVVTTTPEEAFYHTPYTAPKMENSSISNLTDDGYTITSSLVQSDATVSYILYDGTTSITNLIGSYSNGDEISYTFEAPTDSKTYEVLLYSVSARGESTTIPVGTIYGGKLVIEKISDASETGLTKAVVKISRQNADPLPLNVNYSFVDGTAKAGVNFVDNAGKAVIQEGESSVTIEVTPIIDPVSNLDTSLTVAIANGNYVAPSEGVEVSVFNFVTPEGCNYWVAGEYSDGLASNPLNWSLGRTPVPTDIVVWDGVVSQKEMIWDTANNDLTDTVAGWKQINAGVSNAIFYTTYASRGSFTTFNITGDAILETGIWTHPVSRSFNSGSKANSEICATGGVYKLDVTIGGNLKVGTDATISCYAKGAYPTGIGSVTTMGYGTHAGTHLGAWESYGSVFKPTSIGGIGTQKGTDQYAKYAAGSGAIHLTVSGDFELLGKINANSYIGGYGGGGAGSIWVEVEGDLTGTGSMQANGLSVSDGQGSGGGRIAIYANTIASTISRSATANYLRSGGSGAGTVYTQDSTCVDKGGVILINAGRTSTITTNQITPIVSQLSVGGDAITDFRKSTVKVGGGAIAWATDMTVESVIVVSNISKIDLRGSTFKTAKLSLGDKSIPTGTYSVDSTVVANDGTSIAMSDYFVDTSADADGSVVVLGSSFMLIIR